MLEGGGGLIRILWGFRVVVGIRMFELKFALVWEESFVLERYLYNGKIYVLIRG